MSNTFEVGENSSAQSSRNAAYNNFIDEFVDSHNKPGHAMNKEAIKKEFQESDLNDDGFIDLDEMTVHEKFNPEEAKLHLEDSDKNKDGKVSEDEWIEHHMNSLLHKPKANEPKGDHDDHVIKPAMKHKH